MSDLEAALLSGGDLEDNETTLGGEPEKSNFRDSLARGEVDEPEVDEDDEVVDDEAEEVADEVEVDDEEVEEEVVVEKNPKQAKADPDEEFFEHVKAEHGIDLKGKYKGRKEALAGLVSAASLVGKKNQLAEIGKAFTDNPQAFFEHLKKQFENSQPKATAEAANDPNAPEYDEAWLDQFDPSTGRPVDGADPKIVRKVLKYQQFVKNRAAEIAQNPKKALLPVLQDDFRKLAQEEAKKLFDQFRQENEQQTALAGQHAEARELIDECAEWAYVEGDRSKGPTEAGKIFKKYIDISESVDQSTGRAYIENLRMRRDWAVAMTRNELGATQAKTVNPARKRRGGKIVKKVNVAASTRTKGGGWPKGLSLTDALLNLDAGDEE
jgi:hypothetical protein